VARGHKVDSATSLAELLTRPYDDFTTREGRQVAEDEERFKALLEDDDA